MSNTGDFAPPPSIATKSELDRLTEERSSPAPEMHLRPDGPGVMDVHERLDTLRESRIGDLGERLQAARDGLESDHAFAQVQGHAGAAFSRSR